MKTGLVYNHQSGELLLNDRAVSLQQACASTGLVPKQVLNVIFPPIYLDKEGREIVRTYVGDHTYMFYNGRFDFEYKIVNTGVDMYKIAVQYVQTSEYEYIKLPDDTLMFDTADAAFNWLTDNIAYANSTEIFLATKIDFGVDLLADIQKNLELRPTWDDGNGNMQYAALVVFDTPPNKRAVENAADFGCEFIKFPFGGRYFWVHGYGKADIIATLISPCMPPLRIATEVERNCIGLSKSFDVVSFESWE